jgi:hypothetical protein
MAWWLETVAFASGSEAICQLRLEPSELNLPQSLLCSMLISTSINDAPIRLATQTSLMHTRAFTVDLGMAGVVRGNETQHISGPCKHRHLCREVGTWRKKSESLLLRSHGLVMRTLLSTVGWSHSLMKDAWSLDMRLTRGDASHFDAACLFRTTYPMCDLHDL